MKKRSRLQFSYLADELGHIVETRQAISPLDPSFDISMAPLRKPMRPPFIDTTEKVAMWNSYWDNVESWVESERMNERRRSW